MTYIKLAMKNVKTQFRDYYVYMLSMSFSIMVYFTFISLSFSDDVVKITKESVKISATLQATSILILAFVVLFMFYANAFFIRKRKKEIGLYNILGMKKSELGILFFLENLILGMIALFIGILLGQLLSKLFAMILLSAMRIQGVAHFRLSFHAVNQTVLVFLFIFLFLSVQNASLVYRYKLVDLFKATGSGNRLPKNSVSSSFLGLLGILLMGAGYYIALTIGDFIGLAENSSVQWLLALLLIILFFEILGTYLFFNSFLAFLIRLRKKNRGTYYKGMNLITTSELLFRFKKNAISLSTIAILSAVTLSAVGGAGAVYTFSIRQIAATASFDFNYESSDTKINQTFKETLKKYPEFPIKDSVTSTYKVIEGTYIHFINHKKVTEYFNLMKESDYNQTVKKSNYGKPIELKNNQSVVYLIRDYFPALFNDPIGTEIAIKQLGKSLEVQEIRGNIPYNQFATSGDILVIKDDVFKQVIEPITTYQKTGINIENYKESGKLATEMDKKLNDEKMVFLPVKDNNIYQQPRTLYSSKYWVEQDLNASMGFMMYISVFLGLVFMIATGSIIMLKQLAEAEEEIENYLILKKIGVTYQEIKRSIYKQTAFVFLLPIVIASIHTYFAIKMMSIILNNNWIYTLLICGSFIFIYFIFYLFTARAYNRIVNRRMTAKL